MEKLTFLQKAIMATIKADNAKYDFLNRYNAGIRFHSMGRCKKAGVDEFTICHNGESLTRYQVKCKFRPAVKYDKNTVLYQVNVYSSGTIEVFYDGTSYE